MIAPNDTIGTPATSHDPKLPILAELAAEFELELRQLARPVPRTSPWRGVRAPRVARRALVLVALVSLIGGSALAGRSVLAGSRPSSTGPALLSSGGDGPERWQLQAYLHEGSVCYALFVAETVSSSCGAPGRAGVRVASALSPTLRYVAGFARADVAQVLVRVGRRALLLPTHSASTAPGAGRAKLPAGLRWFIAGFSDGAARDAPALVTPRDAAGHTLGPAVLDCSLGGAGAICRRAAGAVSGALGEASG